MAVEEPTIDEDSAGDPVGPVVAQLLRAAGAPVDLQSSRPTLRAGTIDVAEGGAQVAKVHGLSSSWTTPTRWGSRRARAARLVGRARRESP